jgi:hypothetical protein
LNKFYYSIPAVKPKRRLLRSTLLLFALLSAAFVLTPAAKADQFVYETTSSNQFGLLDLSTGAFTQTAAETPTLAGLGEVSNSLYSGTYTGTTFYGVAGVGGGLTSIGTTSGLSGGWSGFGDAAGTLYGVDIGGTLYSVNTSTGAASSIGATGINTSNGYAISSGSSTLYASYGEELYSVNTSTGALTAIGSTGVAVTGTAGFGGLVFQDGTLYGVFAEFNDTANTLYSINTSTGSATYIATVSGVTGDGDVYGLAATPEPGSLGLSALSLVLLLVGSAAYRRGRTPKTVG